MTRKAISPGAVDPSQYKDVRSLTRGLSVLKALNRSPGGVATTTELSQVCGIHRTTVKRILETLRLEGLVRQGEREGQYYLTFEVRRLSEGFEDEDWVSHVATPQMHDAVKKLFWPTDLGTLEGGFVVIRESTHRLSMLSQHKAMIGAKLPVFTTALGRAWLAACSPAEREELLRLLEQRSDWIGDFARDKRRVGKLVQATLKQGYGYNDGEYLPDPHFSAFAVPVLCRGKVLAVLNLVHPKGALSRAALQERFLPELKALARTIGKGSESWLPLESDSR